MIQCEICKQGKRFSETALDPYGRTVCDECFIAGRRSVGAMKLGGLIAGGAVLLMLWVLVQL